MDFIRSADLNKRLRHTPVTVHLLPPSLNHSFTHSHHTYRTLKFIGIGITMIMIKLHRNWFPYPWQPKCQSLLHFGHSPAVLDRLWLAIYGREWKHWLPCKQLVPLSPFNKWTMKYSVPTVLKISEKWKFVSQYWKSPWKMKKCWNVIKITKIFIFVVIFMINDHNSFGYKILHWNLTCLNQ